ncbi:MAG: hypothetical protein K5924_12865 [Chloroflexi bacterium]|jgi:hypothetical protein|nr:hypothetical protein [Chloroflexota bacterium]
MSSRELEDRNERNQNEAVAMALGISANDLDQLDWRLEDHASDDGLLYGHNVYFGEGSDPEILAKIDGLTNGEWVRIAPL